MPVDLATADIELDLSWLGSQGEWGTRAAIGKQGLTLADIQIGTYGDPPEVSDNMTGRPRGAGARPGSYRIGNYSVRTRNEIWLDNASFLYEEALQRQWSSATDVPWHTIEPLPDDIEEAQCELATFFTEVEFVAGDVPARWISQTTPDYFEPRNVLLAQVMDEARHMDVFRKRALANGGGLGLEGPGEVNRMILESRGGWTEAVSYLLLLRGTFTMTMLRYLERHATNPAERFLCQRVLQDKARHLTYGIEHLQYAIAHQDDMALILQQLLFIGDRIFARELKDKVLREALAIVFAGGLEHAATEGMAEYERMMRDFVRTYVGTCEWLGVKRDPAMMPGGLARYLGPA
jgi:hypothetical protein